MLSTMPPLAPLPTPTVIDRIELYQRLLQPLSGMEEVPTVAELSQLVDMLFAASLLRDEGRSVQLRLVLAPLEAFSADEGPPDGWHVHVFEHPRRLSAEELRRLSPAAGFFHSVVGIWRDRERFHIWGILNTGTNWMNAVHGGRRLGQTRHRFPVLHLRDPGRITFYFDDHQVAEIFGHQTLVGGKDVFKSNWLGSHFTETRLDLIEELRTRSHFALWSDETVSILIRRIAQQFIRRIISLMRIGSHGGSILFLPPDEIAEAEAHQWLEPKYSFASRGADLRFRRLVSQIIIRLGQLAGARDQLDGIWRLYRESRDGTLEELDEAFFELARFYADFTRVDGALVLSRRFEPLSFGSEIRVPRNLIELREAIDLEGEVLENRDPQADGTRHRSVYRLVLASPRTLGIVVSQDASVRFITHHRGQVTYWAHQAG